MHSATIPVVLTAVIVANVLSSFVGIKTILREASTHRYSYHDRDYPELWTISKPAPVGMVAEESVHYAIDTPEAMEEWATSQVDGGGMVRIPPSRRDFALAMFHEMHCLRLMRFALGGHYDDMARGHMQHCLNYLRQDILCASDVTLEPADILERDYEVERFGSVHVCENNWEATYQDAEANWAGWFTERERNQTGSPIL
ncbi:hypothetical protein BKA70DRAFT_763748 [Coprinopsis sp. MPI-PUGE-AT-0042]|nr:hypothetical protein BKA70DRAFT_763748 [Coprinopsis sp. MPI-PUGE-AT-0042]